MDYMTWKTKQEAQSVVKLMFGWDAQAEQLCLPEDPNADDEGNAWVLRCGPVDGARYMRPSGYVR
jgi:hypothetical protein